MIPTMTEFPAYYGSSTTVLPPRIQSKTKSFRIEDILDMRQENHIYTGVRNDCEINCYDEHDMLLNGRLDGKRSRGPRKDRTIFSKIQLFRLERRFHDQKYLSSYEKALIAHSLQLTQQQVQTWFQNRRAKAKREEREKKKQGVGSKSPEPLDGTVNSQSSPGTPTMSTPPNISLPVLTTTPILTSPSPSTDMLAARYEKQLSPVMRILNLVNTPNIEQASPGSGSSKSTTVSNPSVIIVKPKPAIHSIAKSNSSSHKFSIHSLTSSGPFNLG